MNVSSAMQPHGLGSSWSTKPSATPYTALGILQVHPKCHDIPVYYWNCNKHRKVQSLHIISLEFSAFNSYSIQLMYCGIWDWCRIFQVLCAHPYQGCPLNDYKPLQVHSAWLKYNKEFSYSECGKTYLNMSYHRDNVGFFYTHIAFAGINLSRSRKQQPLWQIIQRYQFNKTWPHC